jgi:NADPH-dependent glutamate synthase beta subunit-like oxidoreductase
LGAEDVTILYRRGQPQMKASPYEQELAQTKGVKIKHWVSPKKVIVKNGKPIGLECEYTAEKKGKLAGTGETFKIEADMILKAIGQTFIATPLGGKIELEGGRIKIDAERRTSLRGVWAGGDCAAGGQDLTVAAAEDGKRAAESIHVLACLSTPHRQGIQRRPRLQGRLGWCCVEDAGRGRPAHRQRQWPPLRLRAWARSSRARHQQHRIDHRPST